MIELKKRLKWLAKVVLCHGVIHGLAAAVYGALALGWIGKEAAAALLGVLYGLLALTG